jgi:hypothetical protein
VTTWICTLKAILKMLLPLENVNSCHHILRHKRSESILFLTCDYRGLFDTTLGPHILPAWVSSWNYLIFLWTCLSGLLEDTSFICIFTCGFNPTVLHYITVVKCVNGCPKIILDTGLVTDVKLHSPGQHALFIWIFLISFSGIFKNHGLHQYSQY